MNYPDLFPDGYKDEIPAWMDNHVEAYLDGDLSEAERMRFERHMFDSPWEKEVEKADRIRRGLRALAAPTCPDHVSQRALSQARRDTLTALLDWHPGVRPVLAITLLIVLVVSASLIGRRPDPTPTRDAVVERALSDVKWTLAFLSEVGRDAGASVRRDVLEPYFIQQTPREAEPIERK